MPADVVIVIGISADQYQQLFSCNGEIEDSNNIVVVAVKLRSSLSRITMTEIVLIFLELRHSSTFV